MTFAKSVDLVDCISGDVLAVYGSLAAAGRATGAPPTTVRQECHRRSMPTRRMETYRWHGQSAVGEEYGAIRRPVCAVDVETGLCIDAWQTTEAAKRGGAAAWRTVKGAVYAFVGDRLCELIRPRRVGDIAVGEHVDSRMRSPERW
jgi:hypothetical protein